MKLLLNGRTHDLASGSTVSDLVEELGLRPEQVAVERNKALVPRAQHALTVLEEGDELEVVTLVGGG